MARAAEWKAIIMGTDGPRGSWGKKALNGQTYIVGYLLFLERKKEREAAPARETVFNWELQQWQGNTGGYPRVVLQHTVEKVL
jgi:hypothetical protein